MAMEFKDIVDDKSRLIDWNKRDDIKAEMKVYIILTLAKEKYPPYTKDEVFKEILEQAENFRRHSLQMQPKEYPFPIEGYYLMVADGE